MQIRDKLIMGYSTNLETALAASCTLQTFKWDNGQIFYCNLCIVLFKLANENIYCLVDVTYTFFSMERTKMSVRNAVKTLICFY